MASGDQDQPSLEAYELDGGRRIVVRGGSPVAAALEQVKQDRSRRESSGSYQMDWTLGMLGDLLWMRFPEARPSIYRAARVEFERAIETDYELMQVSADGLADEIFWSELLEPALAGYPSTKEDIKRYCRFLHYLLDLDSEDGDTLRDTFGLVFEWITDVQRYHRVLAEADPSLVSRLRGETRPRG